MIQIISDAILFPSLLLWQNICSFFRRKVLDQTLLLVADAVIDERASPGETVLLILIFKKDSVLANESP